MAVTWSRELCEHPLVTHTLELIKPSLSVLAKQWRQDRQGSTIARIAAPGQGPESPNYHMKVFRKMSRIVDATDRLEQTTFLMRNYPERKSYLEAGISAEVWHQYHYATFGITVVSLLDLCLLLVNTAFQLGLHPQDCGERIVTRNDWVRKSGVADQLKALSRTIQPWRDARNYHVHRGERPQIDHILGSGIYADAAMIQFVKLAIDSPEGDQSDLNRVFRVAGKDLAKSLEPDARQIVNQINSFFSAIEPVVRAAGQHEDSRFGREDVYSKWKQ